MQPLTILSYRCSWLLSIPATWYRNWNFKILVHFDSFGLMVYLHFSLPSTFVCCWLTPRRNTLRRLMSWILQLRKSQSGLLRSSRWEWPFLTCLTTLMVLLLIIQTNQHEFFLKTDPILFNRWPEVDRIQCCCPLYCTQEWPWRTNWGGKGHYWHVWKLDLQPPHGNGQSLLWTGIRNCFYFIYAMKEFFWNSENFFRKRTVPNTRPSCQTSWNRSPNSWKARGSSLPTNQLWEIFTFTTC